MFDGVKIRFSGTYTLPPAAVITGDGERDGVPYWQAKMENLTLWHTQAGMTVQGSLTRYLRGENVGSITFAMVRESLAKLEDSLGFPIAEGLVRSLEVGRTFTMKHPPAWYMDTWGDMGSRFQKDTYGNGRTVLYRNGWRSFIGYDKGAQADPAAVPEIYQGKYLLRLEMKIKRVGRVMDQPFTVADLTNPDRYVHWIKRWKVFFLKIPQTRKARVIFTGGPRDLVKSLAAVGITSMGGQAGLLADLALRTDLDKVTRSRIKAAVMDLTQNPAWTDPGELTREFEQQVKIAASHFR